MPTVATSILQHLGTVGAERARRAGDPALAVAVQRVKAYQQRRFALTYADLLASARYRPAAQFFLDELYGPRDFTRRDTQFERVVPALAQLFPTPIVATVAVLAELHALSEQLDSALAARLDATAALDATTYAQAWQAGASAEQRERQVALTLAVGESLDRLTGNPLLQGSLFMMRGPALAAGLGDLQAFLEAGFDSFRAMHGAREFLDLVDTREHRLNRALFEAPLGPAGADLLALLPPPLA